MTIALNNGSTVVDISRVVSIRFENEQTMTVLTDEGRQIFDLDALQQICFNGTSAVTTLTDGQALHLYRYGEILSICGALRGNICIYNTDGRLLREVPAGVLHTDLYLGDLPEGVCILRVNDQSYKLMR